MAQKLITDLQLISSVTDGLNFPSDNGIQSYRATALQLKNYILPDGGLEIEKLAASVTEKLVPPGSVLAFAGTTAPEGFLICNGSAVNRTTYASLFSAIGSAHGTGDGTTTFNIPDYRGRFLRGHANGSANDPDRASRTAMATGGNTGDLVGSIQGDEVKAHTHTMNAHNASATTGAYLMKGNQAGVNGTWDTLSSGGSESRPKNASVNYIIKF